MNEYVTELFAEYAVGNCFLLLRFYARWRGGGVEIFALDDLFAFITMVRTTLFYNLCHSKQKPLGIMVALIF
jgi:hypothetical protein